MEGTHVWSCGVRRADPPRGLTGILRVCTVHEGFLKPNSLRGRTHSYRSYYRS